MSTRNAIGATLAVGALVVASVGIASADPWYDPADINDPAVTDYFDKIDSLLEQFTENGPASSADQEELVDQVTAANKQLQDAMRSGR